MPGAEADLNHVIAGVRASHARLSATLASITDQQARDASRLPDWTVGHVLTHIARNADSHTRMLRAALAGEAVTQYEGGVEARAAAIEAGANRPAEELVADVRASNESLEQTYAAMTPAGWAGHGLNPDGSEWPCMLMPFHRWREVEVHHVDLGLDYTPSDWPLDYIARELPVSLETLPRRLDAPSQRAVVAWLIGRAPQPGRLELGEWSPSRADSLRLLLPAADR